MPIFRFKALEKVMDRKPKFVERPNQKISEYYGENVFNLSTMRQYLTNDAYKKVVASMEKGDRIDRSIADQVASALKEWAISRGATHYTHWFQPLTGYTAEKHDSFITPIGNGKAIEKFEGSALVQQEPDASSFPSGGIRNTFEARGYTVWDSSSPSFVIGTTLCIPTIFISYTGHALDYKMPLLSAIDAVNKSATRVCHYFDKNVSQVNTSLGWEQEYFLVDAALASARPDITMTGRALFGHNPAKSQQLDDHYFGTISGRVMAFMEELELEAHRLGIPVMTRHNEVAPNQFELAPMYEEVNLANDHNLLIMDLLDKVSAKHDFKVLLHEKPFEGINGSGKHNNWSLSTNTGVNLLQPGKNPKSNLQFLTFFVNTIKAIHENADVLRASIASAGNDHRLGANEAPPAIISVFIGSQLTDMLDAIEKDIKKGKMTPEDKTEIKMKIGRIPQVLLDNTDRNRTSAFAFTGNKFEFRAVGSTANCAHPMTVLNTMMAKQLDDFANAVDKRIASGLKKDEAILKELQVLIKESKSVRFEGDGYGEEWTKEAEKRGLSNRKTTPEALTVWKDKKVIELFEKYQVLSKEEILSRLDVSLENYITKRQIEARLCVDIAQNHIIPVAIRYQNILLDNVMAINQVMPKLLAKKSSTAQMMLIERISQHTNGIKVALEKLIAERRKVKSQKSLEKKANHYAKVVKPIMDEVRYHADHIEMVVDDEMWPLPKLREMLFVK